MIWTKKYRRKYIKQRRKEFRRWILNLKETLECKECSENLPCQLHFHHRDPLQKDANISAMVHACYNKERILAEIEKCDVLCYSCHRKWHIGNPILDAYHKPEYDALPKDEFDAIH